MSDNYYKSYDDDHFSDILKKEEFNINMNEKVKYRYQEPIQMLLKNYISTFTPYDNILLFHQTGAGKTCSAITIAEGFKEYITKVNRKIIVLVKNKNIEKNFINELISKCTMGTYEDETQNKTRRRINKTYDIITYGNFTNRVLGPKNIDGKRDPNKQHEDKIIDLSNSIIIIDEVHNVTGNDTYLALEKVLKNSRNYRLILLTATPIYDNVKEIFEISNLLNIKEKPQLLPIRNQLTSESNELIQTVVQDDLKLKGKIATVSENGIDKIIESMRGKVSYISANVDTYPKRIDIGEKLFKNKTGSSQYVYCEMSDYQYNVYKDALKSDIGTDVTESKESLESDNQDLSSDESINESVVSGSGLYQNSNDASTMTYPDNIYGKKGFEKLQEESDYLILNKLSKYSCKLATLLENVNNSKGSIFIYSNFVNYGGINLIVKILNKNGYSQYTMNNKKNNGKQYIVFDKSSPEIKDKYIQAFNHEDNKDGSKIKILLGSPFLSEGITLKNVRQVHILEPYWNMSKINQIIGRAIRNNSHKDLNTKDRKVEIYKYISYRHDHDDILFIDEEKYKLSEYKDESNKIVERILKQISFDCIINKDRNQKYYNNYERNSAECDYAECEIQCLYTRPDIDQERIDDSTYDLNIENFEKYALYYVNTQIKLLFKQYFIWSLSDIISKIKELDKTIKVKVIYIILNDIIKNKTILKDMYNRPGYIINKGDYYIFNPNDINIESSIYNKMFDFSLDVNVKTYDSFVKDNPLNNIPEQNMKTKIISRKRGEIDDEIYNERNNEIRNTYKIYGSKIDDKFRIIDKRGHEQDKQDQRKLITGQTCVSMTKERLKDIINYIKTSEKGDKGTLDIETNLNNNKLCEMLFNYLNENDRIIQ